MMVIHAAYKLDFNNFDGLQSGTHCHITVVLLNCSVISDVI